MNANINSYFLPYELFNYIIMKDKGFTPTLIHYQQCFKQIVATIMFKMPKTWKYRLALTFNLQSNVNLQQPQ